MRLEYRYALYLFAAGALWLCIEYWSGLHDRYIGVHAYYTFIGLLVPIVGLWAALRAKKSELRGHMNFGQGVKTGTIISIILAPLNVIFSYFFLSQISPFLQNSIAEAVQHGMSQEQAEGYFNLNFYMLQVGFSTIVVGVLISAALSAILKTRPTRA